MEIPKTRGVTVSGTLRAMTGNPFTIQDDTLDSDRNRINFSPLPAGTYQPFPAAGQHVMTDVVSEGGRNGARGPGFVQIDMRVGYRARLGGRRTLDIFYETFNVADRANFTNFPRRQPSTDDRIPAAEPACRVARAFHGSRSSDFGSGSRLPDVRQGGGRRMRAEG